ncbi:protein phosphatase CheZ [Curvibacter sp. RS43]|uniref:protein phosphatase CheZ n=1 Tax=Curvibacter microcysteis TaxID=3026419 RepID=UPI0023627B27|nr:protein phosphatase CheZ [Curvibacter sp. RS43]MDD0809784.1 protein phosphatase CheZ [Curvibacter sp. RS43]
MTEPTDSLFVHSQNEVDVHFRLGQLTRQLHDSLNALGIAEKLHGAAEELPDAKSRLSYIARLTGEAAEKVLNSVDKTKEAREPVDVETRRLTELIERYPGTTFTGKDLLTYLHLVSRSNAAMDENLTDIMMAQDFHDLTGQVIARVVNLASDIEKQLLDLLVSTAPEAGGSSTPIATKDLQGPVVDGQANREVVTNQSQVDDLLASLGF